MLRRVMVRKGLLLVKISRAGCKKREVVNVKKRTVQVVMCCS